MDANTYARARERAQAYRRGRSDANGNLQPAIVKAEKMHLYVPTLYVYVYQKFGEKGRPVEREKRDRIMYDRHKSLVEDGVTISIIRVRALTRFQSKQTSTIFISRLTNIKGQERTKNSIKTSTARNRLIRSPDVCIVMRSRRKDTFMPCRNSRKVLINIPATCEYCKRKLRDFFLRSEINCAPFSSTERVTIFFFYLAVSLQPFER